MKRSDAIPYISYCVDDALSERRLDEMPDNARLIGWQCGFEPLFVAVWSYLDVKLGTDDAIDIATDFLVEKDWFANGPTEPDHIF
jgi:hypothetical protein